MSTTSTLPRTGSDRLRSSTWSAIGTTIRIVVTDATKLRAARALLTDDLAALDAACSRFRGDSELIRLEASAGQPTWVSPLLADAIRAALRGARLTDGDLDPTLGRAIETLGYDRDFASVPVQGGAIRVTVRHVPRWRQIELDETTGLLTLPAGVRLDLGATAKARAADRSAERIARVLGCGVLVSLGGDIAIAGVGPLDGWPIRVQDITGDPSAPNEGPAGVIAISAGGLATSSTSARRWARGGDLMHHILDPRTGRPADSDWRTVSVAAGSALDANIASTAAIIRGERAPGWLVGLGLPARLVAVDGSVTTIAGWPKDGTR
ncbi:MAG TPA: FAD:protein FMN transferase [Dermatophilaceae bacterium]|jgi:thiamine biosynthesis lipoprotein ApbE